MTQALPLLILLTFHLGSVKTQLSHLSSLTWCSRDILVALCTTYPTFFYWIWLPLPPSIDCCHKHQGPSIVHAPTTEVDLFLTAYLLKPNISCRYSVLGPYNAKNPPTTLLRITLRDPNLLTLVHSSMRLRCGSGEVRMPAPVGSGGLGQKLPPIFLIGWGLT